MLNKVISGGQTGVDRASLDAAMEVGIVVGGYCPKARKAEDGSIPDIYPMVELRSADYRVRTEKNIKESDGTLILNIGKLSGGTALTSRLAIKHGKPCMTVQLDHSVTQLLEVKSWIVNNNIKTLNIAGPRESKMPGVVYVKTHEYLQQLFKSLV